MQSHTNTGPARTNAEDILAPIRTALAGARQEHLLRFADELTQQDRAKFLAQLGTLDIEGVASLVRTYVLQRPAPHVPSSIAPAKYYPHDPRSPVRAWDKGAMRTAGEKLIRDGKAAAFVVAGGQGSRLGFEGPKGCFPAGPVSKKPLFQIFAEGILGTQRAYSCEIPWYIMTSPLNHRATVAFFEEHGFFGLARGQVMFFEQGVMPSFDMQTGKMLLSGKGEVATNPDGHGGSVRALHASGALRHMRSRGVEQVSYFQVDNPLVRVIDPVFLGLHTSAPDSSGEMSSKMVAKAQPEEKVGVFVLADGKVAVLEYSDMDPRLQTARDGRGGLVYNAGSIAIHAISVEFLERLATTREYELPCHRAEKKIPYVDIESGAMVSPPSNNGVKLERFIFDALAMCERSIVMETDRAEEFAPIKNAEGVDSPASSGAAQTWRAARWLDSAGVSVPRDAAGRPDCKIEVAATTALDAAGLARVGGLPREIPRGAALVI